jgi:hypothetical protein
MSQTGVRLGKYQLVRPLDVAEAGEAHLATMTSVEGFEKQVVLWTFRAVPGRAERLIAQVTIEAKLAASLTHASIAQVLDLDVIDGQCVLATEHVPGRTLEAVLRESGRLPWSIAARVGYEVAAALSYAHSRRTEDGKLLGFVHGRLSPRRIVLGDDGDVKVTGFGTSSAWTTSNAYSSPEEVRGEPIDGRADVFALGVTLRACLRSTRVPEPLLQLLGRTLNGYPERRPTATELGQNLSCILRGADGPVTHRDIAAFAKGRPKLAAERTEHSFAEYLIRTSTALQMRGALFEALDRLELALDSVSTCGSNEAETALGLYERFGRLSVEAHVGERGINQMVRALDLADSLGRDQQAALFCALRGELLAQAKRTDESRDWLERAALLSR